MENLELEVSAVVGAGRQETNYLWQKNNFSCSCYSQY